MVIKKTKAYKQVCIQKNDLYSKFLAFISNANKLYSNKIYSRSKEGAIGLFTNDLMVRKDIYLQIATLLKGQLLFTNKEPK